LAFAYVSMLFTTVNRKSTLPAGVTRCVLSGNWSWLLDNTVVRSPELTLYDSGPRPDPCITLAVKLFSMDV